MALLEASGIGKNFGDTKVLQDISLTLEQGEALAIIGSSGSGGRMVAAVVAFAINYACYFSEIYRGGIEACLLYTSPSPRD